MYYAAENVVIAWQFVLDNECIQAAAASMDYVGPAVALYLIINLA